MGAGTQAIRLVPMGALLEKTSDNIDKVNQLTPEIEKLYETTDSEEDDNSQTPSHFDFGKNISRFHQYSQACQKVKRFYKEQHRKQTVAYNLRARNAFKTREPIYMSVWEAIEKLDSLIDDTEDTQVSQMRHLLQTAEAIRRDGKPRWMQLTGLIHDLGKLLFFYDAEGKWDVVGDTFVVGCAFDESNIYPETFKDNPDYDDSVYGTKFGIYSPNCGLENVMLSWGHDEYMYHICRDQSTLPKEALAMIRYHSFYPWHRAGGYRHLMCAEDEDMLDAVVEFSPYNLYSRSDALPDAEDLKPYYLDLIDEFFPDKYVAW